MHNHGRKCGFIRSPDIGEREVEKAESEKATLVPCVNWNFISLVIAFKILEKALLL